MRYGDPKTAIRAEAHIFLGATLAMAVLVHYPHLFNYLLLYPVITELCQVVKDKKFKTKDAIFDSLEHYAGISWGYLILFI